MEDDKGLDLSLGLPVRRSSSKRNEKISTSLDASPNEGDRTSKILSDFRNFLNGGIPQQPQGSLFNSIPPSAGDGISRFRPSASSTDRVVKLDSDKALMGKRKNSYDDMNSRMKHGTDRNSDKGRTSHISITTDDGSTADNEDVAESDAETSKPVTNLSDSTKNAHASSETPKDLHGRNNVSLPPYSLQSMNSLNVPGSITFKDAVPVGPTASSAYPVSSDRTQTLHAGNAPVSFGYSNGQLSFLDKDGPWGMAGRPLINSYPGGRPVSASGTGHDLSEGKQAIVEEGSSTWGDDNMVSNSSVVHTENSFPSEYPAIRPGMAADLKFGGSGSLPNLPWVSTTGPGPNGRTISGVTYRFSANQIEIVCACHGLHISPEDFIQHASEELPAVRTDSTAAGSSTGGTAGGLASLSGTGNAAASAKS